ncbi:MAG: TetR/AcrR family transcriptional regulator [Candidatus Cloacimonetes bacterium]|nr:TetR/AcrR family transcriptional regulator [Candidatus Cloacimonadota bacterium]
MRRRIIKNDMKSLIIQTALDMIEEKHGTEELNLREIARRAGCSAPNVYNYFIDVDDLLTNARAVASRYFLQSRPGDELLEPEARLRIITKRLIDAVIEKPSWYRFVYFRRKVSDRQSFAEEIKEMVGTDITELIMQVSAGSLSYKDAMQGRRIIHSFLHGELCKLASNIFPKDEMLQYSEEIMNHIDIILKKIIYCKSEV